MGKAIHWQAGALSAWRRAKSLAVLAAAAAVASCGGNGTPDGPTLSGVAATGAPMQGAAVTVTCAAGPMRTGTTGADGAWTVTLDEATVMPCIVSASGGTPPVVLHSLATAAGHVNITPLTNLALAGAAGEDPAAWLASNGGSLATALARLADNLPAALAALSESLADSGYQMPSGDIMTMPFTPAAGDPYDDALEALAAGLAGNGISYADLVARIADAGTTPVTLPKADVITAAQVAAMPQLNNATITVSDGAAVFETVAGAHPVGAFFGGGDGNKAVLQVAGLAGTKVKDLQQVMLDFQAGSLPVGQPYLYINMLIDLDCSAAPLPADATAQQVHARRRVLIYDPFYKFFQADPSSLSTTEFKTLTITPDMPGWRITGGTVSGNDTGVEEVSQSTGTLTTFNHEQFPNACIVDGISADGGLFRDKSADPACDTTSGLAGGVPAVCGKAHSGFLVVLSDSAAASRPSSGPWKLRKLKVNERVFTFQ